MNVNVEYKVGDEISYHYESTRMCNFCGGVGMIYGWDGTQLECPVCHGEKRFSFDPKIESIEHSAVVGYEIKYEGDMTAPELSYLVYRPAGDYNVIAADAVIGIYEEPTSEI